MPDCSHPVIAMGTVVPMSKVDSRTANGPEVHRLVHNVFANGMLLSCTHE